MGTNRLCDGKSMFQCGEAAMLGGKQSQDSMNNSTLFDEILKLTLRRDEGATTDEELARLERLLGESREAVVYYLKIDNDAVAIRESAESRASALLDPALSDPITETDLQEDVVSDCESVGNSGRRPGGLAKWFYLAAACFVLAASGVLLIAARTGAGRLPADLPNVARVVNLSGVEWASAAKHFDPWTPIAPGDSLKFVSGVINLFISNGVEVVIEGPAEVQFASLERVIVVEGKLAARVGPDAIGFSIETPHANVIDRGTAFGISVDHERQTDVVVYEGIVDLDVLGHGEQARRRLSTGEALRVNNQGDLSRIASVQGDSFVAPPYARNRGAGHTPVIESVADNIRLLETTKYNRVVPGGFDEDCRAYVDREHEWNGVDEAGLPACLLGGDYVMTFNDDKTDTGFELTVELAQPANLYLLVDNRVPPPDWLRRDFVKTEMEVGLDEVHRHVNVLAATGPGRSVEQVYSVWHRTVPEASTVVLGPLGHEQYSRPARVVQRGMYGIVATPLGPHTNQD
jgi:FecR protein